MNGCEQLLHRRTGKQIKNLSVQFISLVAKAATRRTFLVKQAGEGTALIEKTLKIIAKDETRRMVYGIVYAPDEVDTQGHTMNAAEIEKAAYGFMAHRRTTQIDTDHDFETDKGYVAESWLIRKGDPTFPAEPEGAWAVGVKVLDDDTWDRIQKGELTGLSMYGTGQLEENADGDDGLRKADGFGRQTTDDGRQKADNPEVGVSSLRTAGDGGEVKKEDYCTEVEKPENESVGPIDVVSGVVIGKDFNEAFARRQLWEATGALRDAIEQAMNDDEVADKYGAVSQATEQFLTWLRSAMGVSRAEKRDERGGGEMGDGGREEDLVEKGDEQTAEEDHPAPEQQPASGVGGAGEELAKLAEAIEELAGRIEAIEKTTTGRQTVLGGVDAHVKKEKGFKGIRIL